MTEGKQDSPTRYYRMWLRFGNRDLFLVWYTNDLDGVVTRSGDSIVAFTDKQELEVFCGRGGLVLEDEEPVRHDLDFIARWIERPAAHRVDCNEMLAAWNLFSDAAASVAGGDLFRAREGKAREVYDKLFRGCNLPALTPDSLFAPQWTERDMAALQEVLGAGLHLLSARLEIESN